MTFDVWNRDSELHPLALDVLRKHWGDFLADTLHNPEAVEAAREKQAGLTELTEKPHPLNFGAKLHAHASRAREELDQLRQFLTAVER